MGRTQFSGDSDIGSLLKALTIDQKLVLCLENSFAKFLIKTSDVLSA
jgi:hypothetical protein